MSSAGLAADEAMWMGMVFLLLSPERKQSLGVQPPPLNSWLSCVVSDRQSTSYRGTQGIKKM